MVVTEQELVLCEKIHLARLVLIYDSKLAELEMANAALAESNLKLSARIVNAKRVALQEFAEYVRNGEDTPTPEDYPTPCDWACDIAKELARNLVDDAALGGEVGDE